ncbi:MAG: endonuclease/exonuclease/phosphatase family protein [Candidatus Heimdallarchaeota archaeon]|nr:endonuclease/exonuclease/phosphatase family protein [Candidatus Heimdallarchaeota archaeon]
MSFFKSKAFIISASAIIIVAIVVPTVLVTLNRDTPPLEEDTIPPTIEIDNPSSWDVLSGEVVIACTADDTGSDNASVQMIQLYLNNTLISSSVPYPLDTTLYSDGPYTLKAIAYDLANLTAEVEIDIVIDNFINPVRTDYFKLLNYNVLESGAQYEWKDVVKAENADILIFVETGTWNADGDEKLNRLLNQFNGYFYEEAPYEGYTTQNVNFPTTGEAIFSRYPILEFNQLAILTLDDNTSYDVTHDFIHAVVNITGIEVHIIGFHLKCCAGETEEDRREWEQEGIINYMDDLGDVPIIYAGDINSLSPFDVGDLAGQPGADFGYGPVTMLLDPEDPIYGNYSSKVHNFTDVFRALNPDDPGYTMNIPTIYSRIDFIFVNQYFEDTMISSNVGTNTEFDALGSDHLSVDAVFQIANISVSPYPHLSTKEEIQNTETQNFLEENKTVPKIYKVTVALLVILPIRKTTKTIF